MRNFGERKAEIMRRSAQRIARRKKARRILLAAVLCLGVSLFLLGKGAPFAEQDQSAVPRALVTLDGQVLRAHTEPETVEKILDTAVSLLAEGLGGQDLMAPTEGYWGDTALNTAVTRYTLTVTDAGGTEYSFILTERSLEEPETGRQVPLSRKDTALLMALLELSSPNA